MVVFPNCKVNLGLHVTGKRADGYHNLQTVFYPVAVKDVLEVVNANELLFTCSGKTIEGSAQDNLCLKAFHLVKQQFPDLPPVHIHLHKNIPMGAGLGGGSSDGAYTLQVLNTKYKLGLSQKQLLELALQLGSDCPFFILNTPSFATGRGEILEPVELDLSAFDIVLVNPGIHVSTAQAFANLGIREPEKSIRDVIQMPVTSWKNELVNDFEAPVFKSHPTIALIKDALYKAGAVFAAMSGSGSTVFGLFEKDNYNLPVFPDTYTIFKV